MHTAYTRSSTRGNHRPLDVDDTTPWATESLINPKRRSDHFRHSRRASPALDPCPDASPLSNRRADSEAIKEFVQQRHFVTRFVRDAIANAVDKQKASADKRGRTKYEKFTIGDKVLLSITGIQDTSVTNVGGNKLAPRFVGPFMVIKIMGDAYTLDIPTAMRLHPTFYVGSLKRYHPSLLLTQMDVSGGEGIARPPMSLRLWRTRR